MFKKASAPLVRSTTVAVGRIRQPFRFPTGRAIFAMMLFNAAVLVVSGPAAAHGLLRPAVRCQLFIGPDVMNFTGYLPDAAQNEFCEDIPAVGRIILTLDDVQEELRDMKIEIRIIKDVGHAASEDEDLTTVTVAYSAPQYYRSGTINFQHNFLEPGYFVGIVTATGNHGERWVSRFPFSVGESFMRSLPAYLLLGLGVIATFIIYLRHQKSSSSAILETVATAAQDPTPAK